MSTWLRELEILDQRIRLECDVAAVVPTVDALTATYARARSRPGPDLRYRLVHGPDAGCYAVWCDDQKLHNTVDPADLAPAFELDLYRQLTARVRAGWLVHGATLASRSGAFVLFGPSGCGKSTLAQAWVARGAQYVTDEWSVVDAMGHVRGISRPIALDRASGDVQGASRVVPYAVHGRHGRIVQTYLVQPPADQIARSPVAVRSLVAIEHDSQRGPHCERLPSHRAVERLWDATLNPSPETMQIALTVLEHVPVWHLVSPTVDVALDTLSERLAA